MDNSRDHTSWESSPVCFGVGWRSHEISMSWPGLSAASKVAYRLLFPCAAENLRHREGPMEAVANVDSYDIQFEKETFRAAVCNRCGARMFPAELLEAHMDRHELKDLYLQSELKKLQFAMNRMR